jgi:hypothetical protein
MLQPHSGEAQDGVEVGAVTIAVCVGMRSSRPNVRLTLRPPFRFSLGVW